MYLESLLEVEEKFDPVKRSDRAKKLYTDFKSIDQEVAAIELISNNTDRLAAMQKLANQTK